MGASVEFSGETCPFPFYPGLLISSHAIKYDLHSGSKEVLNSTEYTQSEVLSVVVWDP